jgi:acyl-CoA synthetase (AMP-forming)/AMP-acid ligase II
MPVRSPHPDLDIPDVDFGSVVLARGRQRPDKIALIDAASDRRVTFGQLIAEIESAAGGLVASGVQPGDVVAVCGFNTISYVVAAHAVWRAGGVVVTVNPLFTVREMHEELLDSGARRMLAAAGVTQRATEAAGMAGISQPIDLEVLPKDAPPPGPRVRSDDTALILYSSGTTGLPKGVELTHRNLIASLLQLHAGDLAREDDVLLALSPFFHVVGLHGVMNLGIYAGAAIVIFARYDFPKLLESIQRFRISSVFLTPPVVTDLAKHPDVEHYDLSSLRSILCAAAPLGPEMEQMAADRLGCVVRQGYGMTEASGPVTTNMAEGGEVRRRGSAGQLVPSTEARIVDLASGQDLGPGENGEIVLRGPQVMKGYLNKPEATAISLEPDGWLHTGDVGYADADGYLFIVDRVKEIIKYKAYQVAPAELEGILATHPAVLDVAVIPSVDEESGEVPKALVVLAAPEAASAEALMAFVAERVAPYKKVRRVEFVDMIPKSASGKILRRVLIERERQALTPQPAKITFERRGELPQG